MSKSNKPQSEQQIARAEKQRIARTEGAKVMAEIEKDAVAVRKNMERLRALRLAREAEEAKNAPPPPAPKKKKADPRSKAQKLAEYLATQRASGHNT
ncbi:MAG: hypothetical protein EKK40_00865 [Bradyrhizobiaceae bacterium]|nr:MAG: hypothetical protein EKK40_00865 [Bradyrhizobiaceae bacterium]